MSNKRTRNKIARAAPQGGTIISPQQMQVYMAQMQAAQMQAAKGNKPSRNDAMFSPGQPLESQPGINPKGLPLRFQYPISYNTFQPDRTLGNQDIPTFQQLRILARSFSGITLCERVWSDMVPKLELKIGLTKAAQAQGADEKRYQKQITFFKSFFDKPDGVTDIHSWLRKSLKEQTQIDEVYWYKQRDRAGRLLGLQIVAGDFMKPLLDDWGVIQGYQQFPRGVPGQQFSLKQMIRYNESPSADTPFGFSRVERIVLEVNQALRKKKKDLMHFTEGNQPFAIMEVPEASNWTPDQIEAYEVMWNSLLAGSPQQQVRMRFTQPGMKYTPLEEYQLLTEFDQFLLNIATAVYGVSMADISFTDDIHKSNNDGQQNMLFRRTLYPVTSMYAHLLTICMREDFPPELNGDILEASFGGFEEAEDLETLATAYSTFIGAGVIAPSDVAQVMKFPDIPKTGPYINNQKQGIIFLDDLADPQFRAAQKKAVMAGMQLATQGPPQQQQSSQEQGGNAQDDTQDDTQRDDVLGEAMDEADQSLDELGRFNPNHGWHGQFGTGSSAPVHHKGRHHGTHHKGHHMSKAKLMARLAKLAARFEKLEDRKISKHWSAAQAQAAGKMAELFESMAKAIGAGKSVAGIVNSLLSLAKTVFAGHSKSLTSMTNALNKIDEAQEQGIIRALDDEEEGDEDAWLTEFEEGYTEDDELTQQEQEGAQSVSSQLSRSRTVPSTDDEVQQSSADSRASEGTATATRAVNSEYRKWRQRAIDDIRRGRSQRGFTTTIIPEHIHKLISDELAHCMNVEEVRHVFERARQQEEVLEGVA